MRIRKIQYKGCPQVAGSWLVPVKFVRHEKRGNQTKQIWLFRCRCGTLKEICKAYYTHRPIRSCGCAKKGNGNALRKTAKVPEECGEVVLSYDKHFGGMF